MVEPQGQGSFLPSFSDNSLFLCIILCPFLTCVSEGYPFLRLLVVSKKEVAAIICVFSIHDKFSCKFINVAGKVGLEPTTYGLKTRCSTIELLPFIMLNLGWGFIDNKPNPN